jgi:predicted transcriptional regulator
MSKKTNLEYHPSQELPFISHLQKLEDSITDSHSAIDYENWEDLKACINILKNHELSDELIIRFTKLGKSLHNTGVIIAPFYDALLSLDQEQLSKSLKEISTFKYKLSENAKEYLFEQIFTGAAASKFNTAQMTEIIYNLSMPNSKNWAKKATEFMTHLSSLKDENQQNYSLIWHRYTEPKMLLEFFKGINIEKYLTPLNSYSQARVIEKIFELKNLKEASDLLKKLSHEINKFLPQMDPSVQKVFIREVFDLRSTETGAELARILLPQIFKLLPDLDKSLEEYLQEQNYFITSPKEHDPNFNILASSISAAKKIKLALEEKLATDHQFKKLLLLTKNNFFMELSYNAIDYHKHINKDIIKTLILAGLKEEIAPYFNLSDIHDEKEQIASIKEIFALWHSEKKLQKDVFDVLVNFYVKLLPKVSSEVQETFIAELFDPKGLGLGHFTAFSKENYELLIALLPEVIEVFSSEKVDSKMKNLLLRNLFDLKNDDYAHLGLPPLLLKLTDLIGTMDNEMLRKFISGVKDLTSWKEYENTLQKQIYLKVANSLSEIENKEVQKLFVKQLIETALDPEITGITIEKILSHKNESSKIDFMEGTMRLMSASPHNDEINEIWVQISKLLPSFTNFEQLMFLAYSFDLIDILKLQEPSSFKPVILEINKFINSMNPINQLELFNKLKSMKDISKIIFSQALNLSDSINAHNHLEVEAETWLLEKIRKGLTLQEFGELFSPAEISFKQKFITKIFNSKDMSAIDLLPFMTPFTSNNYPDIQRTFLIETFSRLPYYKKDCALGKFLEKLLELKPFFFCEINPANSKHVDKFKIFELHKAEAVSDELYNQIINQLGGKDKFFDPSLKLVISKDIDPVVKKLFDKAVYSKDIEGRLDDIALTLDLLVKKDTSGLMKTILETADLSGKFLIQNDVFSPKVDSTWWGYASLHDVVICSMEQQTNMQVATTIIHELTHKLLTFIFENSSNPYYGSSQLPLGKSSSLAQILKQFEPLSQQHTLFSYNKDAWSSEIISHLFQDLAEQILTGKASKSILVLSEKLSNWVKDYLKQEIHDFDSAYEVLGSKILTEYSSQQVIFKNWSEARIHQELETISSLQKIADEESTGGFDITGTILGYLEPEETALEVAGES